MLCARGDAARLVREGATKVGGRLPVNPPAAWPASARRVPAQALAQVCELTWQLRGQAGERQVANAKVGITANQGLFGHGSSVIVRPEAHDPARKWTEPRRGRDLRGARRCGLLTMNRPRYHNAQNSKMTYALDAAFRRAVEDDEDKVIVLGGKGKNFSAGP